MKKIENSLQNSNKIERQNIKPKLVRNNNTAILIPRHKQRSR